jgi:Zn-dependent peptidase ImmA (M78 family)
MKDAENNGSEELLTSDFTEKLSSLLAYLVKYLQLRTFPSSIRFVDNKKNADDILGFTGHYDNNTRQIVVYITDRHPKDILRTVSHEIIHLWQHEHGKLQNHSTGDPQYAQHDPQLRKMEMQAYLLGNILFRDFSDMYKHGNKDIHNQGNTDTRNQI